MLTGRIAAEGAHWIAECESAGAFTQGKSREDARFMLANCIETLINADDFEVSVEETGPSADGSISVIVKANRLGPLAARVLKYQRELSRLTQEEAAKRSGTTHQSEYATYERGERVPSIEKYAKLLAAVAPDYELVVVDKKASKR